MCGSFAHYYVNRVVYVYNDFILLININVVETFKNCDMILVISL